MMAVKRKQKKKSNAQSNSLLKGLIFIGSYFVVSLILEMINFATLGFGLFPKNMLFDFAFWFVVCGLLFLIPKNIVRIIVEAVLLAVQIFINLVNVTLIKNTGLVFHWNLLLSAGNAATSLVPDMINFWLIFAYILIFAAFLTTMLILNKKLKNSFDFNFSKRFSIWLSCVISLIAVGSSFVFIGEAVRRNVQKNAYAFAADGGDCFGNGVYFKNATLRTMGTFGFYFHDLTCLIESAKKASDEEVAAKKAELQKTFAEDTDDFDYAKGNNLIMILLESFDEFSIDPYNTPNLYKLAYGIDSENAHKSVKWGYRFDSFYGLNYTNNSEYISLTGHTTERKSYEQYYKAEGITMPYSLPNLFKNSGTQSVNYFHAFSKEYYHRDEVYSALGFDHVYGIEDSSMPNKSERFGDWVLDSDYIASMIDKFIPTGQSFFSYYATVSTHGPYDGKNKRFDKYEEGYNKNLENFKKYLDEQDLVYPTDEKSQNELKNYKKALMDTDLMIALIFKTLEEKGILENTTLVLFSDHHCFYNDLNGTIRGTDTSDFSNIEVNNIPMIIYNDDLAARSSSIYCNTYDLFPTICDLFDFGYNTSLVQGRSIFRPSEIKKSVFVSFKHGIYNADYYTEDMIDIVQINDEPKTTLDEFKNYVYEFFKKQEVIEFVYRNNVFK